MGVSAAALIWTSLVIPPGSLGGTDFPPAGAFVYGLCLYAVTVRCRPRIVVAAAAEAASYKTADPPPELVESFAEIRASALAGLAELRRVLGVLRTGGQDTAPQPGLADLDALLDSARSGGVSVAVISSGNPVTLPEGVDLSAYRIVQEALSNAMRHAPGSHVQVHVARATARPGSWS